MRPLNLLAALLLVIITSVRPGGSSLAATDLWWLSLGVVLIGAGGYAHNDYCDIRIDRRNRPRRPLVCGVVQPHQALSLFVCTTVVGLGFMLLVHPVLFFFGVMAATSLVVYSKWLKNKSGLAGNLYIAIMVPAPALFVGYIRCSLQHVWPIFTLLFALTLFREMLKDVEDASGDLLGGRSTLATVGAWRLIRVIAMVCVGGAAMITIMYCLSHQKTGSELGLVMLPLGALIGATIGWMIGRITSTALKHLLKAVMFIFIVAFYLV
ncbi:MAG: UbiA family prenyltransferase [Patescibacteria group bacterium]